MKKKNSKRLGIKIKTNINNDIFFFDNDLFDTKKKNYLLLNDDGNKLNEITNESSLNYRDLNNNSIIGIKNYKFLSVFENKYTKDKNNIINKCLIKNYCKQEEVPSNIIIQIIHNNEDIKKLLSLYLNDVIEAIVSTSGYDREILSKIKLAYHVNDGKVVNGNNDENKEITELVNFILLNSKLYGFTNRDKDTIFEYLKAISLLRNSIAHLDKKITGNYSSEILNKEINSYNYQEGKKFLNNSVLNISLIKELYPDHDIKTEIKNYYLFYLNQKDKNLGLSIKKIMEIARTLYPANLDEEQNKKYNVILKYHLFNILENNKELVNKYVIKLRESDFDDKDSIYVELVKDIGKKEFKRVKNITEIDNFNKEQKEAKKDYSKIIKDITNTILKRKSYDGFILQIYALSKFLTIKETNVLISDLINKLSSINDLLIAAKKIDLKVFDYLNDDYLMCNFNLINKYIENLRMINNNRKFTSPKSQIEDKVKIDKKEKKDINKDDFDILFSYVSALNLFKNDLDIKSINDLVSQEIDNDYYKINKIKYPIKNFFRNNVIKSKEFNYIIRYINTKEVSEILYQKPKLVEFLLKNITEEEKNKYFSKSVSYESIANITLDSIIDNITKGNGEYALNIKLYIKCLYFLIKNMININSYYFIAFSFYARDYKLITNIDISDKKGENHYNLSLLDYVKLSEKDYSQINKTIDNFNKCDLNDIYNPGNIIREYRNNVEHISILKLLAKTNFPDDFEFKNYFKIYHYVMQLAILKSDIKNPLLLQYKKDIETYHKYSKNLLYIMNVPFLYNYARYKDISTEEIFNRKYE